MLFKLPLTPLLLCTVGLLCSAGCQPTAVTPQRVNPDDRPPTALSKNVTIEQLNGDIVAGDPIVKTGVGSDLAYVAVPIRSLADRALDIEYRFEFFDSERQQAGEKLRWRRLHIGQRVEAQIDAFAPETGATDWALAIRPQLPAESAARPGS